jgi:hypothetical protein
MGLGRRVRACIHGPVMGGWLTPGGRAMRVAVRRPREQDGPPQAGGGGASRGSDGGYRQRHVTNHVAESMPGECLEGRDSVVTEEEEAVAARQRSGGGGWAPGSGGGEERRGRVHERGREELL